jgi:subtilisin family serine protease
MNAERAPSRPWEPEATRGAMRGGLVLRLVPDRVSPDVPHRADVQAGRGSAPHRIDDAKVDAIVRRYSTTLRITHAFQPASRFGSVPGGRLWDDVEKVSGLAQTFRLELDPDADLVSLTQALRELATVVVASPLYLSVTPFAAVSTASTSEDPFWGRRMIGADKALEMEPGDRALIVGVVDSGVDLAHPELRHRLRPGVDTVDLRPAQVPRSVTLVGDSSQPDRSPDDTIGHGTACASIIGGRGDRLPPGVGGACPLLPARALAGARMVGRTSLTAIGSLSDIDHALKTVIDLGARVVNCSFGTPASALRDDDVRPHAEIVAYARRRGVLLVAASGNSASFESYYPACLDGVIAVGSCDESARPSAFMSRGDHVDLCAPGERVPGATVGGYTVHTGTSFAAPFVAGACALIIAHAARHSDPIAPAEVRELLMRSARPFPRGGDTRGCGSGILDTPAALKAWDAAAAAHTGPPDEYIAFERGAGATATASQH